MKTGYCTANVFLSRDLCCTGKEPLLLLRSAGSVGVLADVGPMCTEWHTWSEDYWASFGVYVSWALLFGVISGAVTMTSVDLLRCSGLLSLCTEGRVSGLRKINWGISVVVVVFVRGGIGVIVVLSAIY
ncbi:hypothetical protein CCP1ISM_1200001 [Azospirillaceae bacterium]